MRFEKKRSPSHGVGTRTRRRGRIWAREIAYYYSRDDERNAFGLFMERRPPRAAPRLLGGARRRRSPLLDVLGGVNAGGDEVGDLGDSRFHARLVEVRKERILECNMVVLHHSCELEELCTAVCQRAGHPRLEGLAQPRINLLNGRQAR